MLRVRSRTRILFQAASSSFVSLANAALSDSNRMFVSGVGSLGRLIAEAENADKAVACRGKRALWMLTHLIHKPFTSTYLRAIKLEHRMSSVLAIVAGTRVAPS